MLRSLLKSFLRKEEIQEFNTEWRAIVVGKHGEVSFNKVLKSAKEKEKPELQRKTDGESETYKTYREWCARDKQPKSSYGHEDTISNIQGYVDYLCERSNANVNLIFLDSKDFCDKCADGDCCNKDFENTVIQITRKGICGNNNKSPRKYYAICFYECDFESNRAEEKKGQKYACPNCKNPALQDCRGCYDKDCLDTTCSNRNCLSEGCLGVYCDRLDDGCYKCYLKSEDIKCYKCHSCCDNRVYGLIRKYLTCKYFR